MHMVIGKFKFLNECIKMVSPKVPAASLAAVLAHSHHCPLLQYHENRPAPVIQKVLYLVRIWAHNLPDETKVKEVYNMLKKQGEPTKRPAAVGVADGDCRMDVRHAVSGRAA